MRSLFAFLAFLLAMTSVAAEASPSCGNMDQAVAAAMVKSAADGVDCHDATDRAGAGFGCDFTAHCALLCGVTPPAGSDADHEAKFAALAFFSSADRLAGAARKPEAPPPRIVVL